MTPDGARRPYIAGNWKMYKTAAEARAYVEDLRGRIEGISGVDIGLCAPFTSLAATLEAATGTDLRVCAQNMHQENEGAYTGEISASMLTEIGVHGVVLGHSERRQYFNETDRALQEKVPAALAAGLEPILCVGESEDEREQGETERRLRHQVQEGLEKVAEADLPKVVIAYEPIWAIGTGKVATTEQAQEAIAFIRALVGDRSSDAAGQVRIQYGGSVKPDNAASLLQQPDVDGALIGGASLKADQFLGIVRCALTCK